MANVSKLLHVSGDAPSFLKNLNLADEDRADLMEAREKIRQCLRGVFATVTKAELGVTVQPKFFMQGSYAYRTINNPAWTPPQQMDLDDGTYLPIRSFKESRSRPLPQRASSRWSTRRSRSWPKRRAGNSQRNRPVPGW
jgi:hypothetical protein